LTDAETTARFWFGTALTSDWKIGSPVTFRRNGELIVSGKVLEFDPPRRLSYTFHSQKEGLHTEQPSRVVLDIEQQKDQVKLTVTHDDFPADSKVFNRISEGWPLVLSSLKSYLETNRVVLHAPWYDKESAAAS
jgi:uncharacterized protein YndB with AHSA1/START domain